MVNIRANNGSVRTDLAHLTSGTQASINICRDKPDKNENTVSSSAVSQSIAQDDDRKLHWNTLRETAALLGETFVIFKSIQKRR